LADGEVLPPPVGVVELDGAVVVEPTPGTAERLLEPFQPGAEPSLAEVLRVALAGAALVSPVDPVPDYFADLKTTFVLLDQAVAADLPRAVGPGRRRGGVRPREARAGHRLLPLVGVQDLVTVRAQDDALRDLPPDRGKRVAAREHVCHVAGFLVAGVVVE